MQFLILLVTVGLRFPITAAIAGVVYTAGRVAYFLVRLSAPLCCISIFSTELCSKLHCCQSTMGVYCSTALRHTRGGACKCSHILGPCL